MPRHSRALDDTEPVAYVVLYILEVHDARVIVILPGKQCAPEISRMHVCERMRGRIPAAEAEVETAYTGAVVVDNNKLYLEYYSCKQQGQHAHKPSRDATRTQRRL